VPEFDIRQWRAARGLPERITNPDVIASLAALLRRDLTKRLATSEGSRQRTQGRTAPRSMRRTERGDADSA
jgi:hypothetical protein